jgi:hypothetical protein
MKKISFFLLLSYSIHAWILGSMPDPEEFRKIAIEWENEKPSGTIEVINCRFEKLLITKGRGKVSENHFEFDAADLQNRIEISLKEVKTATGSGASLVSIRTGNNSFSFFLRDVSADYPIWIPQYHVVVCPSGDKRSYRQIEMEIKNRGLQSKLQRMENEAEESYDSAAKHTRDQNCPTWLGISRDIRIFEMGLPQDMETIIPRMASADMYLPETKNTPVTYSYLAGRGQSVEPNAPRRLEEGVLPILHSSLLDDGIEYYSTSFVSLESSPLNANTPIGTHYLVADSSSYGHMFTREQVEIVKSRIHDELIKSEETVLYYRVVATNTNPVPRYAWFRTIKPGRAWWDRLGYSYNRESGFSSYATGRVFGISKLNGRPLPDEEIAVLLKPNEKAVFEFFLPHSPVSADRAKLLSGQSFTERFEECRSFWHEKLSHAARIKLPEKRIEEMIQAGLLHLDLITYGIDPEGILAPSVGVYSPIGTESSPIIQLYNSMGLHGSARRSLMYFLDKQHDDGMMQNFGGYMVETGAVLWSVGEYYRYTHDTAWVKQIEPKLLKSCAFLLQWRERNKKESLLGKGYGMIDGKVADPEDQFHQYMLNGYAFLGMSRVAEILHEIDLSNSNRLKQEADLWKQDIRTSLFNSMAGSPVVPLGDGTWCPTVPPWTEARAMRLLYLNPETFLSHGTFTVSDAMLGPLYLIFCEVLDPREPVSRMLLNYHQELFYQRNAAFSQPYYSRHNWVQLKQGMTKAFLKTYYNTFPALSDRDTYTFWEHVYKVSVHKTHEEAWFLMETRWMLYLEEGQTLKLLSGVPRKWLEDGKEIEVTHAASYFGPLSFRVVSHTGKGFVEATVECTGERMPQQVILRIPHPEGKKAIRVIGGTYDDATESVTIEPFHGKASVKLVF